MQDREGKPEVPGQWMEHGREVGLPGRRIFLQTFPGAIVICPCAGPEPGLLLERGVMEMEEGWAWPGTDT